jgi:plasmid maintenance system antidote protein VapI
MSNDRPGLYPAGQSDYAVPPGETLAEMMEGYPGRPAEVAGRLGLTEQELEALLTGDLPITGDLAARLGDETGMSTRMWLALEADYRAALTRLQVPWVGVLAPLGKVSVDERMLMAPPPGDVQTRPLPLPLVGLQGEAAGRIDRVWVEDGLLRAQGVAAASLLAQGRVPVGVDLDSAEFSSEVGLVRVTAWRLVGATVAEDAAFPEAYIEQAQGADLRG